MYTTVNQFIKEFSYEYQSTLKVFKNITNESLFENANDNMRSLQRLVWHITVTQAEMLGKAGLTINGPEEHGQPSNNITEICNLYEISAKSVLEQVEKMWTDADLQTEVDMYGEKWTKAVILNVLIKHEVHHRGQLTTLMRLHNLKVPGVYGPSREEWATFGMEAPK